jgi:hypothetical protein
LQATPLLVPKHSTLAGSDDAEDCTQSPATRRWCLVSKEAHTTQE